jgi:PmbA protein
VHEASGFSLSASAIAQDEGVMERAGDGRRVRHHADLPDAQEIGAEAGRRAVSRLGARKLESRTAAVIFENRLAASLLSPLISAIAGPSIARGNSFLKGKLGQPVFGEGINVVDDPHRPRGLGSAPYDDEGVVNERRSIIEGGVLTTWLLNTSSARQLGLETTGHASRGLAGAPGVAASNLHLEPGEQDLAGLMREAGSGVLVTSMFGPSLNANTGDWSVGVSGFWFEGGELAYPVTEITVAGNLIDIYARVVPGSDLEFRGRRQRPLAAGRRHGDRRPMSRRKDLELLRDAAQEAGELALDQRRKGLKVWSKQGVRPVTDADLAVNVLLSNRLRGARPGYGWLSEETADDRARLDASGCS